MGLVIVADVNDPARGSALIEDRAGNQLWLYVRRGEGDARPAVFFEGDTRAFAIINDQGRGRAVVQDGRGHQLWVTLSRTENMSPWKMVLTLDGPREAFAITRGLLVAREEEGLERYLARVAAGVGAPALVGAGVGGRGPGRRGDAAAS